MADRSIGPWLGLFAVAAVASTGAIVGIASAGTGSLPGASAQASGAAAAAPLSEAAASSSASASSTRAATAAQREIQSVAATLNASSDWAARDSAATGIPQRALMAYGKAALVAQKLWPGCHLGWNTIAAIGYLESGNAGHGDSTIAANGDVEPAIIGPVLDGTAYEAQSDTDGGVYDGDAHWDHAVGPLQFIPSTWARNGVDGNGDGVADPNNIDDAAVSAAGYLCASGRDLRSSDAWEAAVRSYNHSDSYIDGVREAATEYAAYASE